MSNYDFLLKLPNKGFLGLTCTGEKTDGLPIVEAPDADNIIGVPLLITSIITQFCVGNGIHFSPKAISFKSNKINPINFIATTN